MAIARRVHALRSTGLGTRAFGVVSGCMLFRCLLWGVVGTPMPGWRASYTAGHGVAFGRPMDCVCDAHAQPFQAFGLEKAIQAAEAAALDRGGTLPPLPEPGCASILGASCGPPALGARQCKLRCSSPH